MLWWQPVQWRNLISFSITNMWVTQIPLNPELILAFKKTPSADMHNMTQVIDSNRKRIFACWLFHPKKMRLWFAGLWLKLNQIQFHLFVFWGGKVAHLSHWEMIHTAILSGVLGVTNKRRGYPLAWVFIVSGYHLLVFLYWSFFFKTRI